MKNKIEDLRNHLFDQLERLSDDESMKNPIQLDKEIKRAASITQIAEVIVDTARAETEFLAVLADGTGLTQSKFFAEGQGALSKPDKAKTEIEPKNLKPL